jgi:hypothetical protein
MSPFQKYGFPRLRPDPRTASGYQRHFALISPALAIQYAREDRLGACFRVADVFAIVRANLGDMVVALVVLVAVSLMVGLLGFIPVVGWFLSIFGSIHALFVAGYLYGQPGGTRDLLPLACCNLATFRPLPATLFPNPRTVCSYHLYSRV